MTRSKTVVSISKDPKKESHFKELADRLRAAGFVVRREKLRQGAGWKVVSGACRALNSKFVFVDPRLPQDDQIMFLKARIAELLPAEPSDSPGAEVAAAASSDLQMTA